MDGVKDRYIRPAPSTFYFGWSLICNSLIVTRYIPLFYLVLGLLLFFFMPVCAVAQVDENDTADVPATDSFFLLKSKGLVGKLARSIVHDTTPNQNLVRIDQLYRRYRGRVIRNIDIVRVAFGVPITDTSKSFKNLLTNMGDALHATTREQVIRNNLFFRENDRLLPILLADNERHLRDLVFLNDVTITVKRVPGTRDSVDVTVFTKDVLSLGGSFRMSSLTKVLPTVREDNFLGRGDKLQVGVLFHQQRARKFGYEGEYIKRNIKGSFIDAILGYTDHAGTFNTFQQQEESWYARITRPLVNPYMKWTYQLDASKHQTFNYYMGDSLYHSDYQYKYYNVDAWAGFNRSARKMYENSDDDRLRMLMGVRVLHTEFQKVPEKYQEEYFYQYADLTAVLASISLFRQDFYKTRYVYGFGRNEDVPQGLDISLTTGWTNKNRRSRPYMGVDVRVNYFSEKQHYFNYTLRVGGYSHKNRYEDINVLGNVEYFSKLRQLGPKWKQRTFITAGVATQIRKELNEPVFLESEFGLPEFQNVFLGGDHRITAKAESVFFSNWSLALFRFAPFVFANAALLLPETEPINRKFYSTIGAGIRSRNESLVFGTLELRMFYFPRPNFNGDHFRVDFNTNIRFKYNSQSVRKPEFIQVN